jgi:hypothetical protein
MFVAEDISSKVFKHTYGIGKHMMGSMTIAWIING